MPSGGLTFPGSDAPVQRLSETVLGGFPHGVLITDHRGRPVCANPAFVRLTGAAGSRMSPEHRACCDVFGCNVEGTALEYVCLTRIAATSSEPLPEIRIDLPDEAAGAEAVWVTAARVDGGDGLLVVEVRPGTRGDRRRRTNPHWTSSPQLRITVLGHTEVHSPEGPVSGAWIDQRPGHLLKLLLAHRDRSLPAEEIAEILWPGAGRGGTNTVRHFVHALRGQLEPERPPRTPSSFVVLIGGGYRLDPRTVHVDADEFDREAELGFEASGAGELEVAERHLDRAARLYGGDFLADEPYAEWALAERNRMREMMADVLRELGAVLRARGRPEDEGDVRQQLAELEPFDLQAQREALVHQLRSGRRSAALRQYGALRARMLNTFGEEPDFRLADLREEAAMPQTPSGDSVGSG